MRKQLFTPFIFLTVFNLSTLANECSFQKLSVDVNDSILENLNLAEVAFAQFSRTDNLYIASESNIHPEDKRMQKTAKSPKYLDAVGKLSITFPDGTKSTCTANLTDTATGRASRVLTSNRHCFFDKENGVKATSITWTTKLQDGTVISKPVKIERLSDQESDVAILSLPEKIPFSKIKPLKIITEDYFTPAVIQFEAKNTIAAGYSTDQELGKNGNVLTYTENLQRAYFAEGNNKSFVVKSFSYSGASGGAIISDVDLSEDDIENPYDQKFLLGTLYGGATGERTHISGNGTEGSNLSMFREYSHFLHDDGEDLFNQLNK